MSRPFNLSPYRFLDVRWSSEQHGGGGSTQNNLEASVVAAVVSGLVKALTAGVPVRGSDGLIELRRFNPGNTTRGSGAPFSVGVITPYSAQKQLICARLSREGVPREAYEVNTVDGFQGREMDAVVLSTVRAARGGHSGPGGTIGFVSDRRRMNVALTRARHCLLIVGDSQTLAARSDDWRALIADAKARDCFEAIEKDGKSPRKGGAPSGRGPGGPGDRSGGKGKDGGGGGKRKLELGGDDGNAAAQGGGKRRRVGGKGNGGVTATTAADTAGVGEERLGSKGTEPAREPPEASRKEKSGKVEEQKKGVTDREAGSVAAKRGGEAKTHARDNKEHKEERAGEGADKLTGKQAAGDDVGPGESKMAKRGTKKTKEKAIGVAGKGGPHPRPILKRKSSVSKKGWKVGKKVQLAKHVHFRDPKHLVQVRYIPRLETKAGQAERGGKEGPGKRGGRKGGLTFQTFVDLEKTRQRRAGKAAPADERLLKGGRNSSATKKQEGGSPAKAEGSPAKVAGRNSEQDTWKERGLGSPVRNGNSAGGTRKGPLPLVAVSGKKH